MTWVRKPRSCVAFSSASPETRGRSRVLHLPPLVKSTRGPRLCSTPSSIYDGSHPPVPHTQRPSSQCQDACKAEMLAWRLLGECGLGTRERKVSRRSLPKPWKSSVSLLGPIPEPPLWGWEYPCVSDLRPPAQDEAGIALRLFTFHLHSW